MFRFLLRLLFSALSRLIGFALGLQPFPIRRLLLVMKVVTDGKNPYGDNNGEPSDNQFCW